MGVHARDIRQVYGNGVSAPCMHLVGFHVLEDELEHPDKGRLALVDGDDVEARLAREDRWQMNERQHARRHLEHSHAQAEGDVRIAYD